MVVDEQKDPRAGLVKVESVALLYAFVLSRVQNGKPFPLFAGADLRFLDTL